jgi:hypothetical protein
MGQTHHPQLNQPAYEWAKLNRKLRWIGMEDDAHHLQLAMSSLPPHGQCKAEDFNTPVQAVSRLIPLSGPVD